MDKDNKLLKGAYALTSATGALAKTLYPEGVEMDAFTRGYLHDMSLVFGGYFALDLSWRHAIKNKLLRNAIPLAGCSLFELAQGVGLYPGTYDNKDFLAYGAAYGLAYGLDKLTSSRKETFKEQMERTCSLEKLSERATNEKIYHRLC